MSVSEICAVVTALAFLSTAVMLCIHSRRLYLQSIVLENLMRELSETVKRMVTGSGPPA